MTKLDKSHPLFHASQQQVAELMGVDRTTVRAWTKSGMPFINHGPGKSSEYDTSIVLYWYASVIQRNSRPLPDMSPCRRLAVARALADRNDDPREERLNRSEFPECFRDMAAGFFKPREIEEAISYAAAIFDMTFYGDRWR